MSPATLSNYLVVGAVLFTLGGIGFLTRRNLIILFLSAEMMLQGVAINFVAFGRFHANLQGQAFVLFLLTVAACEAAIALALILMLYRRQGTLDVPPEPRVALQHDETAPGQCAHRDRAAGPLSRSRTTWPAPLRRGGVDGCEEIHGALHQRRQLDAASRALPLHDQREIDPARP